MIKDYLKNKDVIEIFKLKGFEITKKEMTLASNVIDYHSSVENGELITFVNNDTLKDVDSY